MYEYLMLRDTRLEGNARTIGGAVNQCLVNQNISLPTAFSRINSTAKMYGKIKTLYILCHGYGNGPDWDVLWRGGLGLQLGKEDLTTANVSSWAAIKDSVATIVVHSCGAAYSGPSIMSPSTPGTGQTLMSDLARYTNAVVFAADKLQWYSKSGLNFGEWEGTVYMFLPSPGGFKLAGLAPQIDNVW